MGLPEDKIPILEEFVSVQGEGVNVGKPYYFIRVAGCPLRCNFCDTEYSWQADMSQLQSVVDVAKRAIETCEKFNIEWISITGGEPLLYPKQVVKMLGLFNTIGLRSHIETSGRFYDDSVHRYCDIYSPDAKTPSTGEAMKGYFKGLDFMRANDQVKCLIGSEEDFRYANALNKILGGVPTMVLQPFNTMIKTDSIKNMTPEMANDRPTEVDADRVRRHLGISLQWLLETFNARLAHGEVWLNTIITPQIHVLAYSNRRGV